MRVYFHQEQDTISRADAGRSRLQGLPTQLLRSTTDRRGQREVSTPGSPWLTSSASPGARWRRPPSTSALVRRCTRRSPSPPSSTTRGLRDRRGIAGGNDRCSAPCHFATTPAFGRFRSRPTPCGAAALRRAQPARRAYVGAMYRRLRRSQGAIGCPLRDAPIPWRSRSSHAERRLERLVGGTVALGTNGRCRPRAYSETGTTSTSSLLPLLRRRARMKHGAARLASAGRRPPLAIVLALGGSGAATD